MSQVVSHRGPDGDGAWVEACVGLGHRRLAVIDLTSAGSQPMVKAGGRWVLNYNGEIYNFRELRAELQALGHQFVSRSDSEVVLAALSEWGVEALEQFNGMFALALWDRKEQQLLLGRDRYGIKPLYYTERGGKLLFASEIKALLAHPDVTAELDPAALYEYLTFQNFFTARTLFAGIELLPAGCWMRVGLGRDSPKVHRYWDFSFQEPDRPGAEEDYLEELDRLFQQAVSRQLVSDVPVGSYLSGGMDSGSIVAVAARQLPGLRTFTIGFDLHSASGIELGSDEREKAEHLSYLFQTEHYEMVLKAGDMERAMAPLVWHLEEPRVGQSYPNFYAAKLASRFGKVVLSGAGGDELFGGYPWRYNRAVANDSFEHYVDQYFAFWQRLVDNESLSALLAPIWSQVGHLSTRDIFRDVFGLYRGQVERPEDAVNHSLYFEARTFLQGLLVMEDKLSMAHGLETRLPFLDNELVDFAQSLPVRLKLGNLGQVVRMNENEPGSKTRKFFERTRDGKLLLRQVMMRHIPDEVTSREKQGFSGPDATWFRGESLDYVQRVLFDDKARLYNFLEPSAVRTLVEDHLTGRENRRLLIWSLIYLEQWCRTFLDKEYRNISFNAPGTPKSSVIQQTLG